MVPGLPPSCGVQSGQREQGIDGSRVAAQEDGQGVLGNHQHINVFCSEFPVGNQLER